MKPRSSAIALTVAVLGTLLFTSLASGAMIGIYRNGMGSLAQRGQMVKLSGRDCSRKGAHGVLRIGVGEKTEACALRTPVLGRDLEILATERLLSGTPRAVQHKAYLALQLRAGAAARYEMRVYPLQRKVQLVKVTAEATKYLAIAKGQSAVKGVNKANALRLRATNFTSGPEKGQVKLLAFLGSNLITEAIDDHPGDVSGKASAVAAGAAGNGSGMIVSVDDVVVRIPSPF